MNFPGLCKLTVTDHAICQAIEGYGYGDFVVTITTDSAQVVNLEVSRDAA